MWKNGCSIQEDKTLVDYLTERRTREQEEGFGEQRERWKERLSTWSYQSNGWRGSFYTLGELWRGASEYVVRKVLRFVAPLCATTCRGSESWWSRQRWAQRPFRQVLSGEARFLGKRGNLYFKNAKTSLYELCNHKVSHVLACCLTKKKKTLKINNELKIKKI